MSFDFDTPTTPGNAPGESPFEEAALAAELAALRIERAPSPSPSPSSSPAPERRRAPSLRWVAWLVSAVLVLALLAAARGLVARWREVDVELGAVVRTLPPSQNVVLVSTGYVAARRSAHLNLPVSASLARLLVHEGDTVLGDQLLAEGDTAVVRAAEAQLEADLAVAAAHVGRARVDVADAQRKLTRQVRLTRGDAGTTADEIDARARLTDARWRLRIAVAEQRAVATRRLAVHASAERLRVRAPFAGTVLRRDAEVGESIGASGGPVLLLASNGDLEVQADVAEAQLSRLRIGMPAEIALDAFADRRFRGEVSSLRPMVDRSKAAVTVKVRFVDATDGVLPEMAAKVSFLARPLDEAALAATPRLMVARDAVVTRAGRTSVWIIADGHAHAQAVTVGEASGDGSVELASGPPAGARVVRHPSNELREGIAVKEKGR